MTTPVGDTVAVGSMFDLQADNKIKTDRTNKVRIFVFIFLQIFVNEALYLQLIVKQILCFFQETRIPELFFSNDRIQQTGTKGPLLELVDLRKVDHAISAN